LGPPRRGRPRDLAFLRIALEVLMRRGMTYEDTLNRSLVVDSGQSAFCQ
jgi:hypothetical protein